VISGIATEIDGDGILFGKLDVRMQRIAAPDYGDSKDQEWGTESRQNLVDLVWGKFDVCHLNGSRAGDRLVGICYHDRIVASAGWLCARLQAVLEGSLQGH